MTTSKFKVGDIVRQRVFDDVSERGIIKRVDSVYIHVKLDGAREHYYFLDAELTLIPTHKEFTDEEYEALLV